MGIRFLVVAATVFGLCVLSPIRPVLGLYGYYWFAMMRPDILAWAGPNRYSLYLALATLFSNVPRIVRNLPLLLLNPLLRNLLLFLLVVTISVIVAVYPTLCVDRYTLFLRVFIMAIVIPLILETREQLRWFYLVVAGSLGLLGTKFGIYGLLRGGAYYTVGFGGLLSDNNTMALAFAMAVPLCWYGRLLAPWKWMKTGMVAAAFATLAAVAFTHSRGGILAVGAGLLLITVSEKRKWLALGLLGAASTVAAVLVWDSLVNRMSTLKDPHAEASAKSRIILAQTAPKIWLDYPLFGVGFTETNQQRLIFKYVPPEYSVEYAGKVLHNNWLQILVDSGIFAFLIYCWVLGSATWRMWREGRRRLAAGQTEEAAIPNGIFTALGVFVVGSTFLSRTTFDLYYVLICMTAAWIEIEKRHAAQVLQPAESLPEQPPPALAHAAPPSMNEPAETAAPAARLGFGRIRPPRTGSGNGPSLRRR